MNIFDWCLRNDHERCLGSYRKFYIGPVGRGRNKKDGIIFLDEQVKCKCKCHKEKK